MFLKICSIHKKKILFLAFAFFIQTVYLTPLKSVPLHPSGFLAPESSLSTPTETIDGEGEFLDEEFTFEIFMPMLDALTRYNATNRSSISESIGAKAVASEIANRLRHADLDPSRGWTETMIETLEKEIPSALERIQQKIFDGQIQIQIHDIKDQLGFYTDGLEPDKTPPHFATSSKINKTAFLIHITEKFLDEYGDIDADNYEAEEYNQRKKFFLSVLFVELMKNELASVVPQQINHSTALMLETALDAQFSDAILLFLPSLSNAQDGILLYALDNNLANYLASLNESHPYNINEKFNARRLEFLDVLDNLKEHKENNKLLENKVNIFIDEYLEDPSASDNLLFTMKLAILDKPLPTPPPILLIDLMDYLNLSVSRIQFLKEVFEQIRPDLKAIFTNEVVDFDALEAKEVYSGPMSICYVTTHTQTPTFIKTANNSLSLDSLFREKEMLTHLEENEEENTYFLRFIRGPMLVKAGNRYRIGIEMEYIPDSTDLKKVLEGNKFKPLESEEALSIFRQLLEALIILSENGIVLRDIKLDNILILKDPSTGIIQIKLIDFGLAHFEGNSPFARDEVIGTPEYISPEEPLSEHYTLQQDLWKAGMILYKLLKPSGHPFLENEDHSSAIRTMQLIVLEPLIELHPEKFQDPRLKALAIIANNMLRSKRPEGRYPDAKTLLTLLDKLESAHNQGKLRQWIESREWLNLIRPRWGGTPLNRFKEEIESIEATRQAI